MKGIYLFCTRLRFYWVELPLALLLTVALIYNKESDALLKLYPLIITIICGAVFVLFYFFRAIKISYDEIRFIGIFSSRDKAIITKDKTLILTMIGRGRLQIRLFGNDGVLPELDWIRNSKTEPIDIDLFSGKALGGTRKIKRILSYFGASSQDFGDIFACEDFEKQYKYVTVSSSVVNECKEIRIRMDQTV